MKNTVVIKIGKIERQVCPSNEEISWVGTYYVDGEKHKTALAYREKEDADYATDEAINAYSECLIKEGYVVEMRGVA